MLHVQNGPHVARLHLCAQSLTLWRLWRLGLLLAGNPRFRKVSTVKDLFTPGATINPLPLSGVPDQVSASSSCLCFRENFYIYIP